MDTEQIKQMEKMNYIKNALDKYIHVNAELLCYVRNIEYCVEQKFHVHSISLSKDDLKVLAYILNQSIGLYSHLIFRMFVHSENLNIDLVNKYYNDYNITLTFKTLKAQYDSLIEIVNRFENE